MTQRSSGTEIGGVVLDIEGTTTPVPFVYNVLFPYARAHLRTFLAAHTNEVRDLATSVCDEWTANSLAGEDVRDLAPATGARASIEAWSAYLEWLIAIDRKSPALKEIQGRIWQQGYDDGTLRGEVYDDVRPAFQRWKNSGVGIAIYSSGSVLGQRLLFSHSTAGDLTSFIDSYFDTTVGAKRSRDSYVKIAAALERDASALLFVSDVAAELDAAAGAGFQTRLCVRDGAPAPESVYRVIRSFDEIP